MFSTQKFNLANHSKQQAYRAIVLSDSPSAYWRLGESSGTNAVDEVGSYDGNYVGSPTLGATGIFNGNNAVALDGTQYISESTLSAFSFIQNTAVFTIEFWVKITDTTVRQAFMGNNPSSANKGFFLVFENGAGQGTKAIRITIYKGSTGTPVINFRSPDNSITDSEWHHVSMIHTAGATSSAEIYIDGVSQSITYQTSYSGLSIGDSTSSLFTGSVNNSGSPLLSFTGSIDEVAIYPTALSATQIMRHYEVATR